MFFKLFFTLLLKNVLEKISNIHASQGNMAIYGVYKNIIIHRNLVWVVFILGGFLMLCRYLFTGFVILFLGLLKYYIQLNKWYYLISKDFFIIYN
jgi:hypothetical protein